MPKYWGKQVFSLRSLPEVGQKQKRENKKREILQGLRVAQAAVKKSSEILFFVKR